MKKESLRNLPRKNKLRIPLLNLISVIKKIIKFAKIKLVKYLMNDYRL